jgi:cyclophilin family peptidyl-prolyl cis-trans isomerase
MFFLRALLGVLVLNVLSSRAPAQNVAPKVTSPIADTTIFRNAPTEIVPLADHFTDPDTTGVRLTTVLGNIDIALYDQRTPITVANFKNYIDSGRYVITDPTTHEAAPLFVHRSVPGFVIQSGGWLGTVNPADPAHIQVTQVQHFAPITNEPGISNTRGTIAMAKLSNDPNSATSEWYINLADNGGPPNNLDTVNGGFTVFGRVIGDGMSVGDAIAAVPRYNFGSPFDTLPLRNYTSGLPTPSELISIPAITYISSLSFTASSDHPGIATATVSGFNLLVNGKATGSATITVTATDADGAQVSQSFGVNVIANPVHLANISTRALVGTGNDVVIGGFIVQGDAPKRVVVRALGPSLAGSGLPNVLADPTLEIHDAAGATIASNDNWQDAANSQDLIDAGLAPTNQPNEAAILTTLPASTEGIGYTAIVAAANSGTGIGLVEVYDLDSGPGSSVLNISTRANVGTGNDVLIGGLIVGGEGSQRVLVRAIGPSLTGILPNPLSDPTLTLYDAHGAEIDFNDDWQANPDEAAIAATNIAPTNLKEAAVLPTLAPGAYTAIVQGTGTAPTGTALVEAYAIDTP